MEKKTVAGFCIFFLVLFLAQEGVVKTEAKLCNHLADTYRGPCFTNASCDDHCKNKEHFVSGTCMKMACWCAHNC
ncbi:hypothetical protein HN51_044045 [Arachis hypogaea]|nr:defensin 1 [Arachis duranensis]XP_029144377.1 defensin 1 [Arachis hypogaea]XP_029150578.1 defensin 1 [Arachis hypogaea]XP_057731588.1 defensin 1 [Arachis stenosperma]QHN96182.1 Putative defensin 2 [Arachis hypogaea]QHO31745.1 Putative defensin 2 [Arachis hypogaea]RYQ96791.1 hypothetical protein Ahy_B08g092665 [Arachis hypogaea]RYR43854.1 hypothetical protein Ahy_A08g040250 [Arachis hypogaea]